MNTPVLKASPTVITVGPVPQQVCAAVGTPVMVYNADLTNTAYLGYSNDLGSVNGTAVPPLTYTVMDGSRQLWGMCPTASILLNVTPGGTYQSASAAQIAEQIALSGITYAQPSVTVATFNAPTGFWTEGPITFPNGATGFEIILNSLTNTDPFVTDILLEHQIGAGIVYKESYTVSNYPNQDNQFVRIRGNLHGNELFLSGTTATTAFINGIVPGGGLTAGVISGQINALFSPLGPTAPKISVDSLIQNGAIIAPAGDLFHVEGAAVGASTDVSLGMLQSYAGEAYLNMSLNTAAMDIVPLIQGYTVVGGAAHFIRFPQLSGNLGASGNTTGACITPFAMAGYWYRLQADNVTATAGTVNANVMGRDWN